MNWSYVIIWVLGTVIGGLLAKFTLYLGKLVIADFRNKRK